MEATSGNRIASAPTTARTSPSQRKRLRCSRIVAKKTSSRTAAARASGTCQCPAVRGPDGISTGARPVRGGAGAVRARLDFSDHDRDAELHAGEDDAVEDHSRPSAKEPVFAVANECRAGRRRPRSAADVTLRRRRNRCATAELECGSLGVCGVVIGTPCLRSPFTRWSGAARGMATPKTGGAAPCPVLRTLTVSELYLTGNGHVTKYQIMALRVRWVLYTTTSRKPLPHDHPGRRRFTPPLPPDCAPRTSGNVIFFHPDGTARTTHAAECTRSAPMGAQLGPPAALGATPANMARPRDRHHPRGATVLCYGVKSSRQLGLNGTEEITRGIREQCRSPEEARAAGRAVRPLVQNRPHPRRQVRRPSLPERRAPSNTQESPGPVI